MDRGRAGSNGVAAALHVVLDAKQERVSVPIPNQNMVAMIVMYRAPLTQKLRCAIDHNASVGTLTINMCRERSLLFIVSIHICTK